MIKRIMRAFKLDEISAVDEPAQVHARTVIMKRNESGSIEAQGLDTAVIKRARLTNIVDGHQHVINDEELSGQTSYADRMTSPAIDSYRGGHSHPWVRGDDGKIVIGVVLDHTHTPEGTYRVIKGAGEDQLFALLEPTGYEAPKESNMTPEEKAAADAIAKKQTEDAAAQAATVKRLSDIVALPMAQRSYFDGLPDEAAKDAFLAKNDGLRAADIAKAVAKAADENPVIFTSVDGDEFRKNDDPRLVKMARDRDEDRKTLKAAQEVAENATFEKMATENLSHTPGDMATKVATIKAIQSIPDEKTRDAAMASLKANNENLAKAFKRVGTSTPSLDAPAGGDPDAELTKMAKEHAKANNVPFAKAMSEVMRTPEGAKLYDAAHAMGQPIN